MASSVARKLAIFRQCFTGRTDVYGTYDPRTGRARQVKAPVTDRVLLDHLRGRRPYGVYLLVGDRTGAAAADFDREDRRPPADFVDQARHYGIAANLEISKEKGWHAWLVFERPGVTAWKARTVVQAILKDIGEPATEIFPKQDRLGPGTAYGNFLNVPLWGALALKGRTVFVDKRNGFRPYADQWAFLAGVQRVSEDQLDTVIEINELGPIEASAPPPAQSAPGPGQRPTHGLLPCAQAMLARGVTAYQRVACFRLAVQLKRAGLTEDLAAAALRVWAAKNRPVPGKGVITLEEIDAQTAAAYAKGYQSCGCADPAVAPFCQPGCPLKGKRPTDVNGRNTKGDWS